MNTIQLRYSDDGGNNWSNWRDLDAGTTGKFMKPLVARRLGLTRDRVWEVQDMSPIASAVISASIMADSE